MIARQASPKKVLKTSLTNNTEEAETQEKYSSNKYIDDKASWFKTIKDQAMNQLWFILRIRIRLSTKISKDYMLKEQK